MPSVYDKIYDIKTKGNQPTPPLPLILQTRLLIHTIASLQKMRYSRVCEVLRAQIRIANNRQGESVR